jgi:hypothetical protein
LIFHKHSPDQNIKPFTNMSSEEGFDVVYFLNCRPVDKNRQSDPKNWKSAIVHFAQIRRDTLNSGMVFTPGKDEAAWVTHANVRNWQGYMYGKIVLSCRSTCLKRSDSLLDVSFCERNTKANHFRCMIDPRGSAKFPALGKGQYKENELCGYAAKVPKPEKFHERALMIPIYRADQGKLMRIGDYECFREYYVTQATPPSIGNNWADRNQKPISLWEKQGTIPTHGTNFTQRLDVNPSADQGAGQAANQGSDSQDDSLLVSADTTSPDFIQRDDMMADVEVPLDLSSGGLGEEISDVPTLANGGEPPAVASSDDPDRYSGDDQDVTQALFNPGEF